MERSEADVGHFLFAKNESLIGRGVVGLGDISGGHRGCGCATHQRKTKSGGAQHLDGGGFAFAFLLRSLLDPWHGRILRKFLWKRFAIVNSAKPARKGLPVQCETSHGVPFIFMNESDTTAFARPFQVRALTGRGPGSRAIAGILPFRYQPFESHQAGVTKQAAADLASFGAALEDPVRARLQ
jgi:hypothetical protein